MIRSELVDIPQDYLCPITLELMENPVVAADGHTYEEESIRKWLQGRNISPMTGEQLKHATLTPNFTLKAVIAAFRENLPAIQRENQIRRDLDQAIKLREEHIANILEKKEQEILDYKERWVREKSKNEILEKELEKIKRENEDLKAEVSLKEEIIEEMREQRQGKISSEENKDGGSRQQQSPSKYNEYFNDGGYPGRVTQIDLSKKMIGAEGAIALSQNQCWTNLKYLKLPSNSIGADGAIALSRNSFWTKLTYLGLSSNSIGDKGAIALSQNLSWTNLTDLRLSSNSISDEGVFVLSQNKSWTKLTYLELASNSISAKGAKSLSENKSWTNLTDLELKSNSIGDEGAKAFSQNRSWPKLKTLGLSFNSITGSGATVLTLRQKEFPDFRFFT